MSSERDGVGAELELLYGYLPGAPADRARLRHGFDALGREPVAHAEVGVHVSPRGRDPLELAAELAHEHIDPTGRLDADIRALSVTPNDFPDFLGRHPSIHTVFFNGRKSADLFKRLVHPQLPCHLTRLDLHLLPSTSPAHAAMPFALKLANWSQVQRATERHAHDPPSSPADRGTRALR